MKLKKKRKKSNEMNIGRMNFISRSLATLSELNLIEETVIIFIKH